MTTPSGPWNVPSVGDHSTSGSNAPSASSQSWSSSAANSLRTTSTSSRDIAFHYLAPHTAGVLHVLRVFTGTGGEFGNPLGVVLDGQPADEAARQAIATE